MLLSGRSQCAKAAYCMIQPYNVLEENCGESGKLGGGRARGTGGRAGGARKTVWGSDAVLCAVAVDAYRCAFGQTHRMRSSKCEPSCKRMCRWRVLTRNRGGTPGAADSGGGRGCVGTLYSEL